MPDQDFPGIELLENTPEGDLQYRPDGSGVTRVSPAQAPISASLSGPIPRYGYSGQRGIGGSVIEDAMRTASPSSTSGGTKAKDSNEELLEKANKAEKDLDDRLMSLDGSTAVDPALIRTGYAGNENAPEWLVKYMEAQPITDPYHFPVPSKIDIVNASKYATEQDKLRLIKYMMLDKGLK